MYRDSRARGGYHSHSYRDAARGYRRASPPLRAMGQRRSRGRSRSPFERDHEESEDRNHHQVRDNYRSRHEEGCTTRLMRERSFSPGRSRRSRDRSRDRRTAWDARPSQEKQKNRQPKNDKYHWMSENYKKNQRSTGSREELQADEIHDLREIIKRSRGESADDEAAEGDGYFKEFIPNVQEARQKYHHKSRWSQNEEAGVLSFKKSIHNEIADDVSPEEPEEGHQPELHVASSMDSNPEVPYFDGVDQDLTARQFVKIVEEVGYKNGWTSSDLKCQMAGKLQGAPREWFLKDELMNEPWDKVKVQFIKMHPMDMDYFQQLKKMMDRTMFEEESLSTYFTFKTMLMSAVDITGRRAVSCLIGGLQNAELEMICYQKNFPTPDLLFDYLSPHKDAPQDGGNHQEAAAAAARRSQYAESARKAGARHRSHSQGRSSHRPADRGGSRERESRRDRDRDVVSRERDRPRDKEAYRDRDRECHREQRDRDLREAHRDRDTSRHRDRDRERQPNNAREDFRQHEAFAAGKPDYEQVHALRVTIGSHQLDACNDLAAQCVTMKEESAKYIHLEYSRRRTTIIGFRGVPVMALGDAEVRVGIDQASVKCTVFVVPNICQEKAVVVGQSLRDHQDINYRESSSGVAFKQRAYLDSFSANEVRKEKTNHA